MCSMPVKSETYLTHDNGSRPFSVIVGQPRNRKQSVRVFRNVWDEKTQEPVRDQEILSYKASKVFIDETSDTDSEVVGNSILIRISKTRYAYIGQCVFEFDAYAPITDYFSPIGNSDVPYPYAIDSKRNVYLMIEPVVLLDCNSDKPYELAYKKQFHWLVKSKHGQMKRQITYPYMMTDDEARIYFEKRRANGDLLSYIERNKRTNVNSVDTYIQLMHELSCLPFLNQKIIVERVI